MEQGEGRVDGLSRYRALMAEILARPMIDTTHPLHPWQSPLWLRSVATTHPAAWIGRMAGQMAWALVRENMAAERYRRGLR